MINRLLCLNMLTRLLVLVCAVLLATPVYAGSKIDLVQSDGSIVPMGGVGNAANVALSGGQVSSTTLASSVTTNTTSTAVAVPSGTKTFYGEVNGTGAVTQTQVIYGGLTSGVTSTTGEPICTFTLSGTTHAHAVCVSTAPWLFYIVVTTNTTGTSASGAVTAMY